MLNSLTLQWRIHYRESKIKNYGFVCTFFYHERKVITDLVEDQNWT